MYKTTQKQYFIPSPKSLEHFVILYRWKYFKPLCFMTGATQAMLRRGKTEEMEETEMKAKIQNFVSDGSLTIEEKVSLMKTQLNTEAKCLMARLR